MATSLTNALAGISGQAAASFASGLSNTRNAISNFGYDLVTLSDDEEKIGAHGRNFTGMVGQQRSQQLRNVNVTNIVGELFYRISGLYKRGALDVSDEFIKLNKYDYEKLAIILRKDPRSEYLVMPKSEYDARIKKLGKDASKSNFWGATVAAEASTGIGKLTSNMQSANDIAKGFDEGLSGLTTGIAVFFIKDNNDSKMKLLKNIPMKIP